MKLIISFILVQLINPMSIYAETPKSECERLMGKLVPFAEEMLEKNGEFFPFAGVVDSKGEIRFIAYWDGNDRPLSEDLIKTYQEKFKEQAAQKEIKASGLVYDAKIFPAGSSVKQDGIIVELDHQSDYSVIVYFPYTLDENKKLTIGQISASAGEARIFNKN